MRVEDIQQRLQDIHMEVHSLDSLKDSYDDVNIHTIEKRIEELEEEKFNLQDLLDSCFDQFIGL
jgi:predicted nuclease with TOPRIM domain